MLGLFFLMSMFACADEWIQLICISYCIFSLISQEEYTTQLVLLTEEHREKINNVVPSNVHHCSPTFEQQQVGGLDELTTVGSNAKDLQTLS